MKQDFRHAFMSALSRDLFTLPESVNSCVVFNATPLPELDVSQKSCMVCEQGFRPNFLALENSGYQVEPKLAVEKIENAIVFAGRNRRVNELNITRAWHALEQGGQIIVAGDKTSGIASLRKWVSEKTAVADSFSKFHAVVFWLEKTSDDWSVPSLVTRFGEYETAEGMFSSDAPDIGSQLLVEHFDTRIGNRVADFGGGWGYLSRELLKRSNRVLSIDLYEADWHSLEAAKANLAKTDKDIRYHWCDLTSEYKKHVLDWVIMNPPFHQSRVAEPGLGQRFIQTAASTLPSGGRLLMVANRNLPYEKMLKKVFRAFEILEVRDGFKVIEARK